ncbi:hypothetical protein H0H92_015313 [Tricholoma furcatifolium]|nr:hypothetical protein H0H92_015313 [Tricholoma furcatifolium]
MEDPWANAWNDSQKPTDDEADISEPSWSTGPAVVWSEPSQDQSTLWHTSEPTSQGWADVSKHSSPSTSPPLVSPKPPPEQLEPEIRSPTPTSRPPSPDAFGTFETGSHNASETDLDPWAAQSSVAPDVVEQDRVWTDSWGPADDVAQDHTSNEPVDEWEQAKRQKARQDEHVPPELLASILDEFQSLSHDLWPATATSEENLGSRSGIEGVEGLNAIANRMIPHELTLPPSVQFPKTFTAKHMNDSLRLSRHVPITRLSPFTLYMASKGSTAWETSVKSRVDVSNDDLLPPGWRVVEKEEPAPVIDTKKKVGSGILSFFGRKSTPTTIEVNTRRSESPSRPPSISTTTANTAAPSSISSQTPRPSLDGAKSPVRSSTPVLLGTPSVPVVVETTATYSSSSPITSPDPFDQPQPAPSAMSRFLTRFSRKVSGPGAKESLALSTDDIEFLSDIVPSANEDGDEGDQLRGLTAMLSASPSSTMVPTLPPPPQLIPSSTISALPQPPPAPPADSQDDIFSFFDTPPANKASTPVGKTSLPPLEPSRLPTPSIIPSLPPPTNNFSRADSQLSPSSRSSGLSFSSLDVKASTSRSQTPLSARRTPMAIMSTGSSASGSSVTLPPPPILPPPPPSKPSSTPAHSRASSRHTTLVDTDDFVNFHPPTTAQQSLLSETTSTNLITSTKPKSTTQVFDDFDDFVSSPIRDPSPPRPPAKPSLLGPQTTIIAQTTGGAMQQPSVQYLTSPPHRGSRAADHQRTQSLVNIAAARTGAWPAPHSPLPDVLPPPEVSQTSSAMHQQQRSASTAPSSTPSSFLFFPPPPGFSGSRTTATATPISSPPAPSLLQPQSRTGSPAQGPISALHVNGSGSALLALPIHKPPTAPATAGGLSAQDLSFFEGL